MEFPWLHAGSAKDFLDPRERRMYRFFEVLPGALAWGTLFSVFGASWLFPVQASVFIIAFNCYWLLKTAFLSLHLRAGYAEMKKRLGVSWRMRLDDVSVFPEELGVTSWRDIRHLVILPFYKETSLVIKESLEAIRHASYPLENIFVVLACEDRAGVEARAIADRLLAEYREVFGALTVTVHPADIPGEIPGKGSNEAWAVKRAKEEMIDRRGISSRHVLVSSLDIDTQIPSEYFSCLTYHYCTVDRPLRASYQPIPVYRNNIWEAPAFSRVVANSGTFWQTMQQSRSERLSTFSSHSMPLASLAEIGYWQTNIVSEDSRIFWQFLLFFNGDWRVVPLFFPVFMDANVAPSLWQTAKNVYRQQRRWGWGVENIPYLLFGFWKSHAIPFRTKIYFTFNQLEGFWSWATNALLLFFLGWLPIVLGGAHFSTSVLSYNLPRVTRIIMTLSMFGLVTSAIISTSLLPKRPEHKPVRTYLWMILQWAMLPFTIVLFGSLPGLEAQTRLMFGRRLDFWVTPKYRHQKSESR